MKSYWLGRTVLQVPHGSPWFLAIEHVRCPYGSRRVAISLFVKSNRKTIPTFTRNGWYAVCTIKYRWCTKRWVAFYYSCSTDGPVIEISDGPGHPESWKYRLGWWFPITRGIPEMRHARESDRTAWMDMMVSTHIQNWRLWKIHCVVVRNDALAIWITMKSPLNHH